MRKPQHPSGKDKKAWSPAEDKLLLSLVSKHGTAKWTAVSAGLGSFDRSGKQCRERYHNHLCPGVLKGAWSHEEDALIHALQKKHGNAWAKITEHLPGRTDNAVKNRFWSSERSRIRRKGVALRRTPSPRVIKKYYQEGTDGMKQEQDNDCEGMQDETQKIVTPVLTSSPIKIKIEEFELNGSSEGIVSFHNHYRNYSYVSSPSNSSSISSDEDDEIQMLNQCNFWEGMDDSNLLERDDASQPYNLQLQPSNSIVYFEDNDKFIFGLCAVGPVSV